MINIIPSIHSECVSDDHKACLRRFTIFFTWLISFLLSFSLYASNLPHSCVERSDWFVDKWGVPKCQIHKLCVIHHVH